MVASGAPTASHVPASGDVLPTLWGSISSSHPITFTYHGKSRTVRPYGLVSRNGFWYLVGKDNVRNTQIVFRVDRFDSEVKVDASTTFERPEDFDITTAFARDPKDFVQSSERAIVRVDGGVAPAVLRDLGDTAVIAQHDDGSVDVEVPCANRVAFRTWLFAMVDRAEVLSPPEVREQVVSWLREMAEVH